MTCKFRSIIVRVLPFALAALPAFSAERHNIVLLIPAVLPSVAVNHNSAPALARLKAEGVYFSNSHSGFPKIASADFHAHVRDVLDLVSAAEASHSTKQVDDDARVAELASIEGRPLVKQSTSLDNIVNAVLPQFKAANRPFVLVYRFGGVAAGNDGVARPIAYYTGGDNDPVVIGLVQTADHALTAIEDTLRKLSLLATTNIIVAAEHGTSFVWKTSKTSATVKAVPKGSPWGRMPPGFLAVDIAAALAKVDADVGLFDPEDRYRRLSPGLGEHPKLGNAVIGVSPSHPLATVSPRGDHGVIYLSERLSNEAAKRLAQTIIDAFFQQDYAGGVFVNDRRIGTPLGTLSLRDIGWEDDETHELVPDIVVTFISQSVECKQPTLCAATIADTPIAEGQQLPGSFSRAATWNFMAARGPDFQAGRITTAPASNADVVETIGELLQLPGPQPRSSSARVLTESLRGNEAHEPEVRKHVITSKPSADGSTTEVHLQSVGPTKYFSVAGNPRWTVGIARPERID